MAQGFLVLVQGTYILWRGIDSNMTHTTNSTKDGDADNCAGEESFQQHYTQVPCLLY